MPVMPGMGKRIVVIEDQHDLRLLIRITLRSLGEIIAPSDIGGAPAMVCAAPPDLVVLDVWLGIEQSGIDVCRALRADPATRGVKIILLSACGQQSDIEAGLDAGADRYIVKPFSPLALVQAAADLLGN